MKQLATRGIILRRLDYGEADRIITFLTEDFGKIRVMAKGVRKQKSKLAGGIELFSISEIHFIKGRGDIDTLVSTRLVKHYGNIVTDLKRTELAYELLKVINKIVEDQAGTEYFVVLHESLAALDHASVQPNLVELSFAMRIMHLLGHVPQFSIDSKGNPLEESSTYEFDFEAVSFVPRKDAPFNKNHLKVLKLLAFNNPASLRAVQGIDAYLADLAPLIRNLKLQYVGV